MIRQFTSGLLACLLAVLPVAAQTPQVVTTVQNTLDLTTIGTVVGNTTSQPFIVPSGNTRHQVSFRTGPSAGTGTFSVYAETINTNQFTLVASSALPTDTIMFYGQIYAIEIVTTGFNTSATFDAAYYGDSNTSQFVEITGAPFNTAIGSVADALKVSVANATPIPVIINGGSGGGTAANAVPMAVSTAYEASHIAKASGGNLYGVFGYSSKASAQWIQCYNSATLPSEASVPLITFTVPATSNFSLTTGQLPINFSAGIVCANSSTGPTKTIGSADTWFNILYN